MCRENDCSCLNDTLELIIALQNKNNPSCDDETCARPFLGPTPNIICFNTRPITLYNCCTGALWEFPYTLNDTTGTSTIFRAESLDDCCLTCRLLAPSDDPNVDYVATNSFFTINLKCVGALKCLADTYLTNV